MTSDIRPAVEAALSQYGATLSDLQVRDCGCAFALRPTWATGAGAAALHGCRCKGPRQLHVGACSGTLSDLQVT